jgi:hypothetical protein
MSRFDESKHQRGGEGTREGGRFVARGSRGTPSAGGPPEKPVTVERATGYFVPGHHDIPIPSAPEAGKTRENAQGKTPPQGASAQGLSQRIEKTVQAKGRNVPASVMPAFRAMVTAAHVEKFQRDLGKELHQQINASLDAATVETDPEKRKQMIAIAEEGVQALKSVTKNWEMAKEGFDQMQEKYYAQMKAHLQGLYGRGTPKEASGGTT